MDSFELSKFAGAVLCALLVIVGTKTFIDISLSHSDSDHKIVGYKLDTDDADEAHADGAPAAPAASGTETAAAPAAFDPSNAVTLAAAAKPEDGEALFKKCSGCHNADEGAGAKSGPNLWGVVDRPKASASGYSYSKAMSEKGGNWTLEDLAAFLHQPKKYVPGTKMIFKGFKKDEDLAKMLAYLASRK